MRKAKIFKIILYTYDNFYFLKKKNKQILVQPLDFVHTINPHLIKKMWGVNRKIMRFP